MLKAEDSLKAFQLMEYYECDLYSLILYALDSMLESITEEERDIYE